MKTQVEFRSAKFPPYAGEEAESNPGIWGKRLAEYVAVQLAQRGIASKAISVEDWGCYLPVRTEHYRLALCCAHQNGDDEQFLIFTEPRAPRAKKLFCTIDATPEFARVLDALRQILESDPEIRDIVWSEPH